MNGRPCSAATPATSACVPSPPATPSRSAPSATACRATPATSTAVGARHQEHLGAERPRPSLQAEPCHLTAAGSRIHDQERVQSGLAHGISGIRQSSRSPARRARAVAAVPAETTPLPTPPRPTAGRRTRTRRSPRLARARTPRATASAAIRGGREKVRGRHAHHGGGQPDAQHRDALQAREHRRSRPRRRRTRSSAGPASAANGCPAGPSRPSSRSPPTRYHFMSVTCCPPAPHPASPAYSSIVSSVLPAGRRRLLY